MGGPHRGGDPIGVSRVKPRCTFGAFFPQLAKNKSVMSEGTGGGDHNPPFSHCCAVHSTVPHL
jgi:hypothetical protein